MRKGAEFMEALFSPSWINKYYSNELITNLSTNNYSDNSYSVNNLAPLPFGTGNYVEGAVCNSLAAIFWKIIADFDSSHDMIIIESENGNLSIKNPWIKSSLINTKFKSHIYDTMDSITVSNSENYNYFDAVLNSLNSKNNKICRGELYRWNLQYYNGCSSSPVINSLNPTEGFGYNSNQVLEISGLNFIDIVTKEKDPNSLNVDMKIVFDNIEYSESINNSYGYYFDNDKLMFHRPQQYVLSNTNVNIKIRIYIGSEFIESDEILFLLKH